MSVNFEMDEDDRLVLTMYAVASDGMLFAPEAARSVIGQRTPIAIGMAEPEFMGTVTAAEVVDDGKAIMLTVKVDKTPPELVDFLDIRRFMH